MSWKTFAAEMTITPHVYTDSVQVPQSFPSAVQESYRQASLNASAILHKQNRLGDPGLSTSACTPALPQWCSGIARDQGCLKHSGETSSL